DISTRLFAPLHQPNTPDHIKQHTHTMASGPPPPPPRDDPSTDRPDPEKWSSWFNLWAGRMTPNQVAELTDAVRIRDEAVDVKRVEEMRDWCFNYSPTVIFLQKQLRVLNGEINGQNVKCRRCPVRRDETGKIVGRQSGGFNPDIGILICANEIRDRKHLEDTLAHEMVHAWDHLRWKVDYNDLRHAACTEIRASSLSGECRWAREFFTRGNWKLTQQHQDCVRKRAVLSVMSRPTCKDDVQAVKVVNEVWDSCFADTRPFDEIYR
ncbi:Mitochondrial inner membrane protease atp23, partial [Lachnellula suecica]